MIEADEIREATREVLGRPAYDGLEPSVSEELLERAQAWLADLIDTLLGAAGASGIGRVVSVVLVVALVVAVVLLLVGLRRRGRTDPVVELVAGRDAAALVREADEARRAGRHEQAVRARYGAIVVALVEAGVLAGRPGLTVGEVDEAVRRGAPTAATAVVAAGRSLADVVYGDVPADPATDDIVAAGVAAVARATGRRDLERSPAGASS